MQSASNTGASAVLSDRRSRRVPAMTALLVCVGTGLGAASPAQAQSLPAATSSTLCSVYGSQNVVDPISCATSGAQVQVVLAPSPTLSASGDYPGGFAPVSSSARALLSYSFAVLGGTAGDRVHLDIATLLHWATDGNVNDYAFSRVIVTTSLGEVTANICTFGCGAGDGVTDFNGTLHVDAVSGAINTVYMEVSADSAAFMNPNPSYSHVVADPILSIDPLTPNAGAYSLVFSDGIGNSAAAVPEPANWALMLAGIGALGLIGGRRRSVQAAG
jgi:hypothetical protein